MHLYSPQEANILEINPDYLQFLLVGVDIIRKSLRVPCYQIAANAGVDATDIVSKVVGEAAEIGYDAQNGEIVNMMKTGIIDPTKVC